MHSPMIAALLCTTLALPPAMASEANPGPAALTFAAGFADDHLAGMLARFGGQAPEMTVLADAHGEAVAAVFQSEIVKAVVKYGREWRRNMALAWTPLMTEDELASLTLAGAQSPHVEKYLALREAAGETMRQLSAGLLQAALREVIDNTASRLGAR